MKRSPTLPSDCSSVRHVPARGEAGREACDSVAVSMIADVRLPAARRIHPEGMKDGSRGLSAAIPPVPGRKRPLPGRVPEPPISGSGTRSGVQAGAPLSGGLRFAATPGYRLATLRVDCSRLSKLQPLLQRRKLGFGHSPRNWRRPTRRVDRGEPVVVEGRGGATTGKARRLVQHPGQGCQTQPGDD